MDPITGAMFAEGEWSSLSGMYTTEEADFMAQFLGNFPVSTEFFDGMSSSILGNSSSSPSSTSTFWPGHIGANEGSYCSLNIVAGSSSSIVLPCSSSQQGFYLSDPHSFLGTNSNNNNKNHSTISMEYFCMGEANDNTSSYIFDQVDHECLNNQENNLSDIGATKQELGFQVKTLQPKKKESEMQAAEPAIEEKLNNPPSESSKKRSRNATTDVQKNKRNVNSKKNQKGASNKEEEDYGNNKSNNAGVNKLQPSSSGCSEDESINASQDHQIGREGSSMMSSKGKAASLNTSGRTRASRGSATDPQSLYARKRRERINERLRILQNLVPNGTKVDISTMLEEAVQYVKFLQLQIKLLSSDDLWMYAPIAYNGMSIGLDHLMLASGSALGFS